MCGRRNPGLRPGVGGGGGVCTVRSTETVFTGTRYRKRVSTVVGIGYLGRVWARCRPETRYELETWECIRSITLVSSVSSHRFSQYNAVW